MKTRLTVLCTVDKYGFKHPIEVDETADSAAFRKAGMDSGLRFKNALANGDVDEVNQIKSVEDEPAFKEAARLIWNWDGSQWSADGIEGYWFVVDDRSAWMGHRNRRLAAHFNQEEEEEYPIDTEYGKRQCENMHVALCSLHATAYQRGQEMGLPLKPTRVVKAGSPPKVKIEGYDSTDLAIAKDQWERNRTRH